MFATKISRISDKLTYSEKRITNLLLERSKNFEMMTSEQIAKEVGCGQATVIRLSQKLGYPNFKSMMMDIANDSLLHISSEVGEEEPLRDTMQKLKSMYDVSVNDVMANNTDESLEQAVKLIEKAGTVFCFGIRNSFSTASLLYYRLLETGRSVLKCDNKLEGISMARNLRPDDVLFVVSVSGETNETKAVAEAAYQAGARIVSITGNADNTVQRLSTVALKCAEYDIHTNRFNLVNRASELYLVDIIFIRLWRRNEEQFIRDCEAFTAAISEPLMKTDVDAAAFRL